PKDFTILKRMAALSNFNPDPLEDSPKVDKQ
ncbi:unnamed protein product, partial [Allacma fusca]